MKALLLILFMITGCVEIVLGGSTPMMYYSGYQKTLIGEDFGYHSAIPGVKTSMLTRALDDLQIIAWETKKVPETYSESKITFVWLFAIDVNEHPKKFKLIINDKDSLVFENPTKAKEQEWKILGINGSELFFRGTMVDQHDDLHGIAALTLPASQFTPGESVTLRIVGENAGSQAWYMTFKYDFSEHVRVYSPDVLLKDYRRQLIVDYNYPGDATEISIETDMGSHYHGQLNLGLNRIALSVPEVKKPQTIQLHIQLKDREELIEKVDLYPSRKMEIYVLPHSHTDIGYTELQTEVQRKHIAFIDRALEIIKATKDYPEGARFKWNIEVSWALDSYLQTQPPEKCEQVLESIREGNIGLEGLYNNILSGLCRPEELLQLVAFSTALTEKYDLPPVSSAMISDVPGQTWGMVSAMHHAGIKYFSTAPNYFDRIGNILATWEDKPFYWVGPSENEKVLVWIPYQGYGFSHILGNKMKEENIFDIMSRIREKNYPYDITYMRWSGLGDNWGPEQHISEFIKEWNQKYLFPKLKLSTTDEVFRKFETLYGSQIGHVRGDWTPYWEDGAASSAKETAMNRASSERLGQAETLWALLGSWKYPVNKFKEAWKNVLMFSEHTWGADISVSDPESEKTRDQWELKQAYALHGDQQSKELINLLLSGDEIKNNTEIDVYNLNSWSRSDLVYVPQNLAKTGDRVVDSNGKSVPSQRLSSGELVFKVENIPPFSSVRYTVGQGEAYESGTAVEVGDGYLKNEALKVVIDKQSGNISALYMNGLEKNLVDNAANEQLNQYLFLPGKNLDDLQTSGKAKLSLKESGPLVSSILIESNAPGCNLLSREIRLMDGYNYLDIINTVDKKRIQFDTKSGDYDFARKNGKEGLHFAFPFNIPEGVMRLDIPYAIMRPEKDQIPSACKNWFTVQRFIDVSNNNYGVTWANLDAPMVEVGAITGNILGNLAEQREIGYWRRTVDPTQKFYSWVMNNHWHTNYRAYQEGVVSFRYAIQPHTSYDPVQVTKFGIERSQPLLTGPARDDMPVRSRLNLDNKAVIVTALKPGSDGKYLILRLFSTSGKNERVSISWSEPRPVDLWLSDLREKKLSKIKNNIYVPAGSIVTLRAEMR